MNTKGLAFLALLVMAVWTVSASGQVDVASATLKAVIDKSGPGNGRDGHGDQQR
jgi:hypothetical protein